MRTKIYLLLVVIISSCQGIKQTPIPNYITQITARSTDLDIETVIDITCEDFENQFEGEFKTRVIKDSDSVNRIIGLLNNLKPVETIEIPNVNTRIKLEFRYNNDSVETVCMDKYI